MSTEWFDVVNERDEVVRRALRQEVHAYGLKHRAVHVLVFNSRGQLFLQKRSQKKDREPGVWDSSASGHVDAGEDYDSAAARELQEELGVTLSQPLHRWFKLDACDETDQEFVWVYRLQHDGPFVWPPEEVEDGAWFEPSAVSRWVCQQPAVFARAFRYLWAEIERRRALNPQDLTLPGK
ncbi:MAG: NUDIX domain-containing protein [Verrucomicrobiota bacterium]|nr:NUDIX domain-containing protein [Limisphaera sp.]MDW8380855.1 NUDIX domain-containing protein [Verrucomicrobiota bacterium]